MTAIRTQRFASTDQVQRQAYEAQLQARGLRDANADGVLSAADGIAAPDLAALAQAARSLRTGLPQTLELAEVRALPIKPEVLQALALVNDPAAAEELATLNAQLAVQQARAVLADLLGAASGRSHATLDIGELTAAAAAAARQLAAVARPDTLGLVAPASIEELSLALPGLRAIIAVVSEVSAQQRQQLDTADQAIMDAALAALAELDRAAAALGAAPWTADATGGPWKPARPWTPALREQLAAFATVFSWERQKAGQAVDRGALAPEILVAFARQHQLPLTATQLGAPGAPAAHLAANPLQAARQAIRPISDERAGRVRQFHHDNFLLWRANQDDPSQKPGLDCLETFNRAVRTLEGRAVALGSTVDLSVQALQGAGLAGQTRAIEFADQAGRPTTGVTPPAAFRPGHSVAAAMREQAGEVPGWHFYAFSFMDGLHSIMLVLDNRDPANPQYYWADQWPQSTGWKPLSAQGLDDRVLSNVAGDAAVGDTASTWGGFWRMYADGFTDHDGKVHRPKKIRTQCRLTKLIVPR